MTSTWAVIFARYDKEYVTICCWVSCVAHHFSACESDFSLTGEYEERALVYGLIDPNQPVQLFRIQKAFLGEESAFVMAQRPDSSYFKYQDLFVELIEYNSDNGNELNRWVLDTVVVSNKDTGDPADNEIDFFGPEQRLYSTADDKILEFTNTSSVNVNVNRQYEISLKKRPVGVSSMTIANMDTVLPIADSKISIVDASLFRFSTPNQNGSLVTAQKMTLVNTGGDYIPYNIKFNGAENAVEYEVWMRFHYREVRDNVETPKSIEWLVARVQSNGSGVIQAPVPAEQIYSRIGSEVPVESNVIRKIGKTDGESGDPYPNDGHTQDFDIFVRIAGEELFEYIDINNQSNTGVLQDKPVYTNINNGLGLFSSRTQIDFIELLYLSTESYDELVGGTSTSGRGFVVDPN